MQKMIRKRVLVSILLFLSLFFLPWWITSVFAIVFLMKFNDPYEVVAVGFFIDYLYRVFSGHFVLDHLFLLVSAGMLLLSYFLKEHITFSRKTLG